MNEVLERMTEIIINELEKLDATLYSRQIKALLYATAEEVNLLEAQILELKQKVKLLEEK
jgi:hypothetical protein